MDSNDNYRQILDNCLKSFNDLSKESDSFLTFDSQKSQQFMDLTKSLFDLNKGLVKENVNKKSKILSLKTSLNELFTTGFDSEQIWQQIQLQNQPIIKEVVREVAVISTKSSVLSLNLNKQMDNKSIDSQSERVLNEKVNKNLEMNDLFSEEEEESDEEKTDIKVKNISKNSMKSEPKSVVDDMFFKLHDFHKFLDIEDLKEEKKNTKSDEIMSEEEESDEEIDYFQDSENSEIDSEDDQNEGQNTRDLMFNDFFDAPVEQNGNQNNDGSTDEESDEEMNGEIDTRDVDINDIKDKEDTNRSDIILDEDSSSDSEDDNPFAKKDVKSDENKSEFEKIDELFKEKIAKQERENLMAKSWQMSGEISSEKRPENSLLEEHLHFDHTSRPAPLITEETTFKLEDIIKQRIKDIAFDDVMRKVKPKEKPFEYRRRITMESEKNKESLAQVYEKEYLKQQQKEAEDIEKPEHKEIKKLMRNLFVQLDALSNFHFTPRPPQPEIKIINNLPAITAEEVTPLATSDVSLLAPQEVFNKDRRELQSNAEKSKTDRKRSRRFKKKIQSKKFAFNEKKTKILNKKKSKESTLNTEDTKHLSSSKKFFDKLQEKTNQLITKTKTIEKNNIKKTKRQSNKLKL